MDTLLWHQLKEAFEQYDTCRTEEEQQIFLSKLRKENSTVHGELLLLIQNKTEPFETEIQGFIQMALEHSVPPGLEHLGNYHLKKVLGVGGGSVVFYATRQDLFNQPIAVKIFGMISEPMKFRFEREAQILVLLKHPYITTLYDIGVTDSNLCYLAMEYVQGTSLDVYADEQQLSISERIGLFLKICEAISYAHKQDVIHRDLKLPHILITAEGYPKILDFGVAKWLTEEPNVENYTSKESLTPAYTSPEQLLGQPITPKSDIFSLGIILYELLSGLYPYPKKAFSTVERLQQLQNSIMPSIDYRYRKVCQQESKSAQIIARKRQCTPADLSKKLQGDLSAVIDKALQVNPEDRYESVEAFMTDLKRVQHHQPIQIKKRWIPFPVRKFYSQHATTLQWSFLIGFLSLGSWFVYWTQLRQNATEKEDLMSYMEEVVMKEENLFLEYPLPQQDSLSTYRMIRSSMAQFGHKMRSDPEIKLRLLDPLIRVALLRDLRPLADSLIQLFEIEFKTLETNPSFKARLLQHKGRLYGMQKDYPSAIRYLEQALTIWRKIAQEQPYIAETLYELGIFEGKNESYEKALVHIEEALGVLEKQKLRVPLKKAACKLEMGRIWMAIGNYTKGDRFIREAKAISTSELPTTHPFVLAVNYDLSNVLQYQNKVDSSAIYLEKSLSIAKVLYGESHVVVGYMTASYAFLLRELEQNTEAIRFDRQALQVLKPFGNKEAVAIAKAYRNMAMCFSNLRQAENAISYADSAIQFFKKEYPADDFQVLKAVFTKIDLNRVFFPYKPEVVNQFKTLLVTFNEQENEGLFAILLRLRLADTIMLQSGNLSEAKALLDEAERLIYKKENPLPDVVGEYKSIQGYWFKKNNQAKQGATLMKTGYDLIRNEVGDKDPIAIEAQKRMTRN